MASDTTSALRRAARLMRLGDPAGPPPRVSEDGDSLTCPDTGRKVFVRGGIIDLLGDGFEPTLSQRSLDTAPSAWFYDWIRPRLAPWIGMPSFDVEVRNLRERLALEPGATVLDIACGQGNFTLEIAKSVGPEGLVIGVDIATAMLERAVLHLRESGLENVVLVRADALQLPFADECLSYVNCSGGLHQFPNVRRAVTEMARVSRPGARMTISGFASATRDSVTGFRRWAQGGDLNFVPMDDLERDMQSAGYEQIGGEMPGRWVGYRWGIRSQPHA